MRKMLSAMLAMALFVGMPTSARADCCDDILSCAAAVATDGLSCVVIETISVVKHLLDVVGNVKDNVTGATQAAGRDAQQQVADTINTFKSQIQLNKDQLSSADQLAASVYNQEANGRMVALRNPSASGLSGTTTVSSATRNTVAPATQSVPASVAQPSTSNLGSSRMSGKAISSNAVRSRPSQPIPTPGPAAPSAVLANAQKLGVAASQQDLASVQQTRPLAGAYADQFSRGVDEISKLKMAGVNDANRVNANMEVARLASNQQKSAQAIEAAQKAITAPLVALTNQLTAMLNNPMKIFDPSAAVNSEIDSVFSTVDTSIQQMVDSITADAKREFDAAQPPYTELQADAARATKIAAAMDALRRDRTPEALNTLNGLLPKSATSTLNDKGAMAMMTSNQMSHIQVMQKFTAGKLQVGGPVKMKLQEVSNGITQLKTLHNRALTIRSSMPTLRSNLSQKMNGYFTGKTPAELASQKEQLIAQAKSRFANDPKTRDAVISLLNSEASKHQSMQRH